MSVLRTLSAVVLLLIWMPATTHCAMEAADLLPEESGCDSAHGCETKCVADNCQQVEDSFQPRASELDSLAAPELTCLGSVVYALLLDASPPSEGDVRPGVPRPAEPWIVTWNFERRAALPARAPSIVSA